MPVVWMGGGCGMVWVLAAALAVAGEEARVVWWWHHAKVGRPKRHHVHMRLSAGERAQF